MSDEIVDNYITLRHGAVKVRPGFKESWVLTNYGRYLPESKHAQVLEIGPGLGETIGLLSELGYTNVAFVDHSLEVINRLSVGTVRGHLVEDLVDYFSTVDEGSISAVVMFHVIEHLPAQVVAPVRQAIKRALCPGGSLLLETPNMVNPLTAGMHRYHDFTHKLGFTSLSLQQVLTGAGFSSVETFAVRPSADTPARFIQINTQRLFEFALRGLMKIYNPSYKSVALSQFIGVRGVK